MCMEESTCKVCLCTRAAADAMSKLFLCVFVWFNFFRHEDKWSLHLKCSPNTWWSEHTAGDEWWGTGGGTGRTGQEKKKEDNYMCGWGEWIWGDEWTLRKNWWRKSESEKNKGDSGRTYRPRWKLKKKESSGERRRRRINRKRIG